jgi:hypothetical protein
VSVIASVFRQRALAWLIRRKAIAAALWLKRDEIDETKIFHIVGSIFHGNVGLNEDKRQGLGCSAV